MGLNIERVSILYVHRAGLRSLGHATENERFIIGQVLVDPPCFSPFSSVFVHNERNPAQPPQSPLLLGAVVPVYLTVLGPQPPPHRYMTGAVSRLSGKHTPI